MRTLYGPIRSWRFGRSLGVDPLAGREKRCPLSCIYCQYGPTRRPTTRRQTFVPAQRLRAELEQLGQVSADWVTFAGLGEPTLAANLAELLEIVRAQLPQPALLLTGGALLPNADVLRQIQGFDAIVVKLDAPDQDLYRRINRPGPGTCGWPAIVASIRRLRQAFAGRLILEMMFVEPNQHAAPEMAALARSLEPDEVQLNTPLQPALGGPISAAQMRAVEDAFAGVNVTCIYRDGQARCSPRTF